MLNVGRGVTYNIGGDYYPYTITKVWNHRRIAVMYDTLEGNDIRPDVEYRWNDRILTLRKNGNWIPEGEPIRNWGVYTIGYRLSRLDPSF